jgi:hypothetical protein
VKYITPEAVASSIRAIKKMIFALSEENMVASSFPLS